MMRVFRVLMTLMRNAVWIVLATAAGAIGFVLFSNTGGAFALRMAESQLGLIHAEGFRGRLVGPLHLDRFRYEDDTVSVDIAQVDIDWSLLQLLRAEVRVHALGAASVKVIVKPPADTDTPKPDDDAGALTSLPIRLNLSRIEVALLHLEVADAEPIELQDIMLDGRWIGDTVSLEQLAATTPWVGAVHVRADAKLKPDGVEIAQLLLSGAADAALNGTLGYGTPSDLLLRWSRLQWPLQDDPVVSSPSGELRWRGLFDDWQYELQATLDTQGQLLETSSDGTGNLSSITADRLAVDGAAGHLTARADMQWSPQLRVDGRGELRDFDPAQVLPDWSGEINAAFDIATTMTDGAPHVEMQLRGRQSTLRGYDFTADGGVRYAGDVLTLQSFRVRSGNSTVRASGRAWPTLALQTDINSSDLASLWPDLVGKAEAHLRIDGDPAHPRVRGQVRATSLAYREMAAESVTIDTDIDLQGALQLRADVAQLQVGRQIDQLTLTLDGSVAQHTLGLELAGPDGQADAALVGALSTTGWTWNGTLQALHLLPTGFADWMLETPSALRIDGADTTLEPSCLASDIARVCVGLRPLDATRRLAFRLERFQLAALNLWMPPATRIEGAVDGTGTVDFDGTGLRDLRLRLDSGPSTLSQKGLPSLRMLPGHVEVAYTDDGLTLQLQLPTTNGGVSVDALLGQGDDFMQRPIRGSATLSVPDLAWLPLLNRELEDVSGQLQGQIELGGSLERPNLQGQITVKDAALRLRSPGIRIDRVQALLQADGAGPLTLQAEAWSDDGPLRVQGSIDPWATPLTVALSLEGQRFQAVRTPEARIWISPALKVNLAQRQLRVDGSVDIPKALIQPKTLNSGVAPSSDQIIIREEDDDDIVSRLQTFANVLLRLGDDVRFDGLGLKTRLTGQVRVQESPGVPTRANGELRLVEGRYKAYGQDLTVETGRLLFTGGSLSQPAVELKATRSPTTEVTVGVLVRGTLDKPEFSLFSTPTMPQENQLSWLVLGRSLDDGGSSDERAMMADAALSLGFAGSEWLAQRFSGRLGIDEVNIGAQPGESSDQAQLTIGKYLSPKIFISYGVSLFQPGHTFRLQYDIGHGFKLASETGAESGGDILYTIER